MTWHGQNEGDSTLAIIHTAECIKYNVQNAGVEHLAQSQYVFYIVRVCIWMVAEALHAICAFASERNRETANGRVP